MSADVEVVFTPWPWDAVARGVALLDEEVSGWRIKLDAATLDLRDCEECVLGQLFGWYASAVELLGLESERDPFFAGHFGFCLPSPSMSSAETDRRYEVLSRAWREAIAGGAA